MQGGAEAKGAAGRAESAEQTGDSVRSQSGVRAPQCGGRAGDSAARLAVGRLGLAFLCLSLHICKMGHTESSAASCVWRGCEHSTG